MSVLSLTQTSLCMSFSLSLSVMAYASRLSVAFRCCCCALIYAMQVAGHKQLQVLLLLLSVYEVGCVCVWVCVCDTDKLLLRLCSPYILVGCSRWSKTHFLCSWLHFIASRAQPTATCKPSPHPLPLPWLTYFPTFTLSFSLLLLFSKLFVLCHEWIFYNRSPSAKHATKKVDAVAATAAADVADFTVAACRLNACYEINKILLSANLALAFIC